MSLTDDIVIRELAGLTERALPSMDLAPAAVVSAGRRRRRRMAGARVALVAGLGVAVAGVVIPALDPPDAPAPGPATAELALGLVATPVNAAEVVPSSDGDMLALADSAGERYTVHFDAAEGMVVLGAGTQAAEIDEGICAFGASRDAADEGEGILQAGGYVGDALLVAGYVAGPGEVRLEWSSQGSTRSLELPTFAVPGAAGRVYLVRIDGAAPEGSWPLASVVYDGTVDHRADIDLAPLEDRAAQTVELALGVVAVQAPVQMTLEDGREALGLGVQASTAPEAGWTLALVPLTETEIAQVAAAGGAVDGADAGTWIVAVGAGDADQPTIPLTWSSADSPRSDDYRWDTMLRYGLGADDSRFFMGVVPPWLEEPRVVLFSRTGFVRADGGRVQTLEAPVYRAPTGDGRMLYTVAILAPDDGVDGFATDIEATFAIGADGTVVLGQRCAGLSLDECAAILGPDVLTAVRDR